MGQANAKAKELYRLVSSAVPEGKTLGEMSPKEMAQVFRTLADAMEATSPSMQQD